jgi:hypothetical protein
VISVLKLKIRAQVAKEIGMSEEETEAKRLNKPPIFSFLLSLLPFF